MTLEYAPGQLLHEPELISSLGLGRTPVREALQRLAAEKLVVARPRQTAFVAPILAQELAEIVEMRLVLEVPAARLAAERGTMAERERLRAACAKFRGRVSAEDMQGTLSSDSAIHGLIAAMTRNSFLSDYSDRLTAFSQRVWWLSVDDARDDTSFAKSHDALERTICAGDPVAAARAATEHVGQFQARLGRLVQPVSPGTAPRPQAVAAPKGGRQTKAHAPTQRPERDVQRQRRVRVS